MTVCFVTWEKKYVCFFAGTVEGVVAVAGGDMNLRLL